MNNLMQAWQAWDAATNAFELAMALAQGNSDRVEAVAVFGSIAGLFIVVLIFWFGYEPLQENRNAQVIELSEVRRVRQRHARAYRHRAGRQQLSAAARSGVSPGPQRERHDSGLR